MKHDYLCPDCGKRIATFDTDAESKGVFCWCKNCKKPVEILLSQKESRENGIILGEMSAS